MKSQSKSEVFKVSLALKLRAETTMTLGWIAQRLHMGTRDHLKHLLYWHDRAKPTKETPIKQEQPILL